MPLSKSDTRAKRIAPVLHDSGWTEDLIRREETAAQKYTETAESEMPSAVRCDSLV